MRVTNRAWNAMRLTVGLASLAGFALMPLPPATSAAAGAALDAPLVDAVRQGDAAAVRALLDEQVDVDAREAGGATALHWAVRLDRRDLAELLVAAGADAMAANAFDVTPLSLAAVNGSAEMLALLLEAGADPNVAMAGSEAVLLTAARTGRVEAVRTLIAHGADVNVAQAAGQTPLMWAAAEGHVETLQALIEAGAAVDARTAVPENPLRTGLEGPAPHGFTALLFAVRAGHIDAVRVLLDAGADVNDTLPDGMSTVVLAATNAHWELGVHLVDRGADPNGAEQGWTALHAMTWVRMPNFGFNPPGPVTTGSMDSLAFARPLSSAASSASSSTTPPRATFTSTAPGFMAARNPASTSRSVSDECGQQSTTTSASPSRSPSLSIAQTSSAKGAGAALRRTPVTRAPNAPARLPISRPILPYPTTSQTVPPTSRNGSCFHSPAACAARRSASPWKMSSTWANTYSEMAAAWALDAPMRMPFAAMAR